MPRDDLPFGSLTKQINIITKIEINNIFDIQIRHPMTPPGDCRYRLNEYLGNDEPTLTLWSLLERNEALNDTDGNHGSSPVAWKFCSRGPPDPWGAKRGRKPAAKKAGGQAKRRGASPGPPPRTLRACMGWRFMLSLSCTYYQKNIVHKFFYCQQ